MPRLLTLDFLRVCAIWAILVMHCWRADLQIPWIGPLRINGFLWCGVDLFFVLSGFLITGILLRTRGQAGAFSSFITKRCFRIFPLYFFWLALFFGVGALAGHDAAMVLAGQIAVFATYTTNFAIQESGSFFAAPDLNHLWSLAVEEQFYLLWPLGVLFTKRSFVLTLLAGLVLLAVALKLFSHIYEIPWAVSYTSLLTRADALLMGALAAIAYARDPRSRAHLWIAIGGALASLVVLAVSTFIYGLETLQTANVNLVTPLYGALFASGLYLLVRWESAPRPLYPLPPVPKPVRGFIEYFANISYGLYMSHLIIYLAFTARWAGFKEMEPHLAFLITMAVTIGISTLLYYALELPFQRLGKGVLARKALRETGVKSAAKASPA